jgi:hypothetical protein
MINFKEVKSLEEANSVNLDDYVFIRFSETRDCYIFKIRETKR